MFQPSTIATVKAGIRGQGGCGLLHLRPDFMRAQVEALKALGVPDARVHYEVFGTDVFEE